MLKKYGSQMTLDGLILKQSSKCNGASLAGQQAISAAARRVISALYTSVVAVGQVISGSQFGDCLTQQGCTVLYWTGKSNWLFVRERSMGCTVQELCVNSRPVEVFNDFVGSSAIAQAA